MNPLTAACYGTVFGYWYGFSIKRMRAIRYTRGQDKKAALYLDLIQVTRASLAYLDPVYHALAAASIDSAQCAFVLGLKRVFRI